MTETECESPLVSVIIPAYNARKFLSECLESIQAQTYPNIEVIVVDDGSTDGTSSWLQDSFPEVQYIWQENSGACAAPRNTGARAAKGSLLTFLDADDVMLPNDLASRVNALDRFPSAVVSVTNYQNFDHDSGMAIGSPHFDSCGLLESRGYVQSVHAPFVLGGEAARSVLAEENFSIASGLMIRREAFATLGGFDEHLRASEDFHLAFRAARLGNMALVPSVGFMRRMHLSNMSNESRRILDEKVRSRQCLLVSEENPEIAALLRRQIGDFNFAIATALRSYSRRERWAALLRSIGAARQPKSAYIKACLKLAL